MGIGYTRGRTAGSIRRPPSTQPRTTKPPTGIPMWVIFLEALVALTLLLVIVWATWPRKNRKSDTNDDERDT